LFDACGALRHTIAVPNLSHERCPLRACAQIFAMADAGVQPPLLRIVLKGVQLT